MKLVLTADPIIEAIGDNPVVTVDTETSSLYPWRDGKILAGIGVKPLGGESFYLPFRHKNGGKQANIRELARLGPALRGRELVFHNPKFDLAVLWQDGLDLVDEDVVDTVVLIRLVSEAEPSYELKRLARKYVDPTAGDSEKALKALIKKMGWFDVGRDGKPQPRYDMVPAEYIASPYVEDDLRFTEGLYLKAMPFIERRGLMELLGLEKELTKALFHMERRGFKLDRKYVEREFSALGELVGQLTVEANGLAKGALRKRSGELGAGGLMKQLLAMKRKERAEALKGQDRAVRRLYVGVECVQLQRKIASGKVVPTGEFDIYSSHDVKKVFEALGIESTVKTKKSNDSWAKAALAVIDHPLADVIVKCRGSKNTLNYYANFLELMDADDVLHCSVHQAGARTGRMSCRSPNLQNIPVFAGEAAAQMRKLMERMAREKARRYAEAGMKQIAFDEEIAQEIATGFEGELLGKVRGAFVPRPGCFLLSVDWSQIEMLIFAAFAGEEDLLKTFDLGLDIHKMTALAAFGSLPDPDKNPELYAWVRGLGKQIGFGLLFGMGIALLAIELGKTKREAKTFMDNYFAHLPHAKRWIDGVHVECEDNGFVVNLWGRRRYLPKRLVYKAVNFLAQGTAADLMKDALVRVFAALAAFAAKLLIPIHDEMIFEVPYGEKAAVVPAIMREMTTCPRIKARITCGLKWSPTRWSEAEKLDCDGCGGSGRLVSIPGVEPARIEDTLLDALYRRDKRLLASAETETCAACSGSGYDLAKVVEPKGAVA